MSTINTAKISEKVKSKKNLLMRSIRRNGSMGRLDLARQLQLSNSRVCDFVQEMLDDRLLTENHAGSDRRGRRGVPVELNPEFGHFVGFDMEAKRLRLILVDFSGHILWKKQEKLFAPNDRSGLIDCLLKFIEKGMKEIHKQSKKILGIGLAGAGVVDSKRGVLIHYDLLEAASDIPLRDLVANATGLPCIMEDNIRALTLAEWISGSAQHLHSFICLAVRSGVGAGIVLNNKLFTGSHGFAGEAGFLPVTVGSQASQWKFLHNVVSEQALQADIEATDFNLSAGKAKRAGELLGAHLAAMATMFDPEGIVLAGELIQPASPLYDTMIRTFHRFVLPDIADRVKLLPARLGPFAAALGATHKCFQMLYPVETN
jgi:predicted NBD/HSP70 family sugar kinase